MRLWVSLPADLLPALIETVVTLPQFWKEI